MCFVVARSALTLSSCMLRNGACCSCMRHSYDINATLLFSARQTHYRCLQGVHGHPAPQRATVSCCDSRLAIRVICMALLSVSSRTAPKSHRLWAAPKSTLQSALGSTSPSLYGSMQHAVIKIHSSHTGALRPTRRNASHTASEPINGCRHNVVCCHTHIHTHIHTHTHTHTYNAPAGPVRRPARPAS